MSNIILDGDTGLSIDADIDEAKQMMCDNRFDAHEVIDRLSIAQARCDMLSAWLQHRIDQLRRGSRSIDWLD